MNSEFDYKSSGFIIGLLLQSIFSAMFGIIEILLLIRLNNFYDVVLFHSLCNILEFPSFNWISNIDPVYKYRYCIIIIYVVLIVLNGLSLIGIVLFIYIFTLYTDPLYFQSFLWKFITQ